MKMRTVAVVGIAVLCAGTCLARPFGPRPHGGFRRPAPVHHVHRPPHHHHHHHGGAWGAAVVGGLIGGAIANAVAERETVVVQQPVVQTQSVWVEGRFVDQVQANGTVVRVWQPGHYEQQTVVVQ